MQNLNDFYIYKTNDITPYHTSNVKHYKFHHTNKYLLDKNNNPFKLNRRSISQSSLKELYEVL